MKNLFKGNRYNFRILLFPLNQRQSFFAIKAMHKRTKRTSFITTVNVILSELNVPLDEPRFWESDWILKNKEANKLAATAQQVLSNKKLLPYLEKYLDLDREQGEWENYE